MTSTPMILSFDASRRRGEPATSTRPLPLHTSVAYAWLLGAASSLLALHAAAEQTQAPVGSAAAVTEPPHSTPDVHNDAGLTTPPLTAPAALPPQAEPSTPNAPSSQSAAPLDAPPPAPFRTTAAPDEFSASAATTQPPSTGDQAPTKKKGKKKRKRQQAPQEPLTPSSDTAPETTDSTGLVTEAVAGDPWGNHNGTLRANGLMFRFLVQGQYEHTFGVDSKNRDPDYRLAENTLARSDDGWDISRVFFGINAEPNKFLHLKVLVDFAEFKKSKTSRAVKQAYVELRPIPKHLHLAAGILKLPFSIHELDSIAAYEFTSSGRTNALLNMMDMAGRDIGAELIASPLARPRDLKLTLGAYRGHASEEEASPFGSMGARAETEPLSGLRLGTGAIIQPKVVRKLNALNTSNDDLVPNPEDADYPRAVTWKKGYAYGIDATYRNQGFVVRGEGLVGTRVDYNTRYGADHWAATWGIVAYKFNAGAVQLEPAVRVEYLDANLGHRGGLYGQYTVALGAHFGPLTKVIIDLTRTEVEPGTPYFEQPTPLRAVPFNAIDSTCITGRLQVAL